MKTAILLLAIAVTAALIKLVMLNLQIRNLQRRINRIWRRTVELRRKNKSGERQAAAFIAAATSIAKEQKAKQNEEILK